MRITGIIVFMLLSTCLLAQQERETDFELWLKAGGDVKLSDRFELAFEEQLRFDEDVTEVKNYHTELELKYNVTETFDLRLVSRYVQRNNGNGFDDFFRYQIGAGYKHKWNRLNIKYRVLFQNRNELGVSEAEGDIARHFLRTRTSVEYKIRDWKYDPIFKAEYFFALNSAKAGTHDGVRFNIGTERKYDKLGEFGIFYAIDLSVNAFQPETAYILSLKYTYSF